VEAIVIGAAAEVRAAATVGEREDEVRNSFGID